MNILVVVTSQFPIPLQTTVGNVLRRYHPSTCFHFVTSVADWAIQHPDTHIEGIIVLVGLPAHGMALPSLDAHATDSFCRLNRIPLAFITNVLSEDPRLQVIKNLLSVVEPPRVLLSMRDEAWQFGPRRYISFLPPE